VRCRDKDRHQLFLEPEGLDVDEIYVNGISTSLPKDVQEEFVHTIDGLEKAKFIRYAYAVEYDAIDSRQLNNTLESKDYSGLFFAGQVNGTSGYEEAAGQGIIAGINAAHRALGRGSFSLTRADGYIGVLIDDLILKGSDEPYRMFTSRAEYRLLLREDNADLRLSPKGIEIGLLSGDSARLFQDKLNEMEKLRGKVDQWFFYPNSETNERFSGMGLNLIKDRVSAGVLLRRPEVTFETLRGLGFPLDADVASPICEQIEIQAKYQGYIEKDLELLAGVRVAEGMPIPGNLDFNMVAGLSNEIKGRLATTRPQNLGQASRIQGVTPAAVANLMIHLKNLGVRSPQTQESSQNA
jgi:tRNA uridine 5-carboxymethylaminomethyl modification enzyme